MTITELESTPMTTTPDTDTAAWDGDGAGDAETTVVPEPTQAAPTLLAWSETIIEEPSPVRSWRRTYVHAAALMCGGLALAAGIGYGGWALHQSGHTAAPQPSTVTAAPAPPKEVGPAPTSTPFNDGDGEPSAAPPPSAAPMSPDDRFISWLNTDGLYPQNRVTIVQNAHGVCEDMSRDVPHTASVASVQAATGLPGFAAEDFVRIAVQTYCPQYLPELVK